uniref:Uncharacterized protein n=1 Tax=Arundo donax TaxID=35708 RepID=A0A0A9G812_ARUDO
MRRRRRAWFLILRIGDDNEIRRTVQFRFRSRFLLVLGVWWGKMARVHDAGIRRRRRWRPIWGHVSRRTRQDRHRSSPPACIGRAAGAKGRSYHAWFRAVVGVGTTPSPARRRQRPRWHNFPLEA